MTFPDYLTQDDMDMFLRECMLADIPVRTLKRGANHRTMPAPASKEWLAAYMDDYVIIGRTNGEWASYRQCAPAGRPKEWKKVGSGSSLTTSV